MKLFLRYQLTGAVFIGWFIILYYGGQHSDLQEIIKSISNLKTDHALLSAFVAYPIGVLIHQFSVLLKNMVFAKFHSSLSDAPLVFDSNKICSNKL